MATIKAQGNTKIQGGVKIAAKPVPPTATPVPQIGRAHV